MRAVNYLAEDEMLHDNAFETRSKDPEELRKIFREKVLPVYKKALELAEKFTNGERDKVAYWEDDDRIKQG